MDVSNASIAFKGGVECWPYGRLSWIYLTQVSRPKNVMTARRGNFQGASCAFLSAHLCHVQYRVLWGDLSRYRGFERCLTCQVLNDRHQGFCSKNPCGIDP